MPRQPLEDKPGQLPYGQRSSERRRAQNREAQRLLRERRQQHEVDTTGRIQRQDDEIASLKALVDELRAENVRLLSHTGISTSPSTRASNSMLKSNKTQPSANASNAAMRPSSTSNYANLSPSRHQSRPVSPMGDFNRSATSHPLSSFESPAIPHTPSIVHIPPALPATTTPRYPSQGYAPIASSASRSSHSSIAAVNIDGDVRPASAMQRARGQSKMSYLTDAVQSLSHHPQQKSQTSLASRLPYTSRGYGHLSSATTSLGTAGSETSSVRLQHSRSASHQSSCSESGSSSPGPQYTASTTSSANDSHHQTNGATNLYTHVTRPSFTVPPSQSNLGRMGSGMHFNMSMPTTVPSSAVSDLGGPNFLHQQTIWGGNQYAWPSGSMMSPVNENP